MLDQSDIRSCSTEELVELAQRGDAEAYRQLHERYNARLLRGLRMSMPPDMADDAAQEAWVRAYEKLGDLDKASSFFAWLASIARNSARSLLRSPESRVIQLDWTAGEAVDRQGDPYEAAELKEREDAARSALEHLPDRQRRALQLRWMDGRSHRAIAGITGQSLSAVETLLYRARSNFHRQYESALSGVEASDDVACYKVRAQIRRLGDGQLSERRRARVLNHLDRCARCRAVHERMGENWDARGWLPFLALPGSLRDLLTSWVGRLAPASPQMAATAPLHVSAGAALVVGVGALVTTITLDHGRPIEIAQVAEAEPSRVVAESPEYVGNAPINDRAPDVYSSPLTESPASDDSVITMPAGSIETVDDAAVFAIETSQRGIADHAPAQETAGVYAVSITVDVGVGVVTQALALANELVFGLLDQPVVEHALATVDGILSSTIDLASSQLGLEP